jgi:hypothetical protein
MAKKRLTNEQVLKHMIKELNVIELALLRVIILESAEAVIKDKEILTETMKKHIISPDLYVRTMERIKMLADFEKE